MLPSEKESLLIGSLIQGSHEAFEELYFIYVKAIRANINKIITEYEDIDDLVQEVFVALWQNKEKLDPHKGIADWLYVVSFNKVMKRLKKKISQEIPWSSSIDLTLISEDIPSEDLLESKLPLIQEAIEKLPERKKLAFCQYKLEGNSLDEVAAKMGITKDAVKKYLKDARRFILAYVAENDRSYPIILILLTHFLH
jgi:RNA polymerase sigma factor (sigma-70 family)